MSSVLTSDVGVWLKSLLLDQYLTTLEEAGYGSMQKCATLTSADLDRVGITLPGHQKRILSHLPTCAGETQDEESEDPDSDDGIYKVPPPTRHQHGKECDAETMEDQEEAEYVNLAEVQKLGEPLVPSLPPKKGSVSRESDIDEKLGILPKKPVPQPRRSIQKPQARPVPQPRPAPRKKSPVILEETDSTGANDTTSCVVKGSETPTTTPGDPEVDTETKAQAPMVITGVTVSESQVDADETETATWLDHSNNNNPEKAERQSEGLSLSAEDLDKLENMTIGCNHADSRGRHSNVNDGLEVFESDQDVYENMKGFSPKPPPRTDIPPTKPHQVHNPSEQLAFEDDFVPSTKPLSTHGKERIIRQDAVAMSSVDSVTVESDPELFSVSGQADPFSQEPSFDNVEIPSSLKEWESVTALTGPGTEPQDKRSVQPDGSQRTISWSGNNGKHRPRKQSSEESVEYCDPIEVDKSKFSRSGSLKEETVPKGAPVTCRPPSGIPRVGAVISEIDENMQNELVYEDVKTRKSGAVGGSGDGETYGHVWESSNVVLQPNQTASMSLPDDIDLYSPDGNFVSSHSSFQEPPPRYPPPPLPSSKPQSQQQVSSPPTPVFRSLPLPTASDMTPPAVPPRKPDTSTGPTTSSTFDTKPQLQESLSFEDFARERSHATKRNLVPGGVAVFPVLGGSKSPVKEVKGFTRQPSDSPTMPLPLLPIKDERHYSTQDSVYSEATDSSMGSPLSPDSPQRPPPLPPPRSDMSPVADDDTPGECHPSLELQ